MDYLAIIKRAYHLTLKHKFLWIFGILAGGSGGLKVWSGFPNYSWNNDSSNLEKSFNNPTFIGQWSNFWANYGTLVMGIIAVVVILGVVLFVLSIISQGALIGSAKKLDDGDKSDFGHGFSIGLNNFWRVWGVLILYLLMFLASLVVLIIPVTLMIIGELYVLAVGWFLLLFAVCLIFWILAAIISPYSLRVVVLEKLGIWDSIRKSLHLFRRNLSDVLIMYLMLMVTGMVFGFLLVLAFVLAGGILVAIGYAIWLASSTVAIIYASVAAFVFFCGIVVLSGAYNAFYSCVITLTYERLKGKS